MSCKYVFGNKPRTRLAFADKLWSDYVYGKQTYQSLAAKYGLSSRTIQRKLEEFHAVKAAIKPRDAVIIMDTSYFRRNFGVMVFRDHYRKENVYWKYLKYETVSEYKSGIDYLKSLGWNIRAIVCDGRRGIFTSFEDIPIQMCQRHQVAIIRRYITKSPRLEAGKELKDLVLVLTKSSKENFSNLLDEWHRKWKKFLSEKSYNETTEKWHYTHKRLRSAYRSLKTNLPYLFAYLEYPDLDIPNTTNSIEGLFSNLKTKLRVHSGIREWRKKKIIDEILSK